MTIDALNGQVGSTLMSYVREKLTSTSPTETAQQSKSISHSITKVKFQDAMGSLLGSTINSWEMLDSLNYSARKSDTRDSSLLKLQAGQAYIASGEITADSASTTGTTTDSGNTTSTTTTTSSSTTSSGGTTTTSSGTTSSGTTTTGSGSTTGNGNGKALGKTK